MLKGSGQRGQRATWGQRVLHRIAGAAFRLFPVVRSTTGGGLSIRLGTTLVRSVGFLRDLPYGAIVRRLAAGLQVHHLRQGVSQFRSVASGAVRVLLARVYRYSVISLGR